MVLCVGRVPMVAVWLKPSCRRRTSTPPSEVVPPAAGPSRLSVLGGRRGGEGGPVGGEGEGGPVGGEGEGGRLGLFSSPLPGLFSSPHPGLFSPPPWYSRPDYRSDCRSRRWGDTRARRRYARPGGVGMGGGRAAAAVPPSPALTSPSCFSSNQPVSLRGGGGGSALGRRVRARAARDLFREGTVGRVSISRARTISRYIMHCL